MKKKILVVSILGVFILVAISLASGFNTGTATAAERKDSPLFGIRTRRATRDRLQELRESIKTRFIGERIFFLPFSSFPRLQKILNPEMYSKLSNEGCMWTDCVECTYDGSKFCEPPSQYCSEWSDCEYCTEEFTNCVDC